MSDHLDIPDFLRIDQEERRKAWRGVKITKPRAWKAKPRDEDPQTRAFRKELERKAAAKKAARLKALRENYQSRGRRKR